MKEHENRPGSVDSDILQGKADVLRAVQATVRGQGGGDSENNHSNRQGGAPVRVEVRPVVAVRSDKAHGSASAQRDNGGGKAAAREETQPSKAAGETPAVGKTPPDSAGPAKEKTAKEASEPESVKSGENKILPQAVKGAEAASEANAENDTGGAAAGEPKSEDGESGGVPRFRLAEQILAEQRRSASGRRQRSNAGDSAARTYAAQDTVGEVIREVKNNLGPTAAAATAEHHRAVQAVANAPAMDEEGMTAIQRQIVAEIVARDIALYSRGAARRRVWPGNGSN